MPGPADYPACARLMTMAQQQFQIKESATCLHGGFQDPRSSKPNHSIKVLSEMQKYIIIYIIICIYACIYIHAYLHIMICLKAPCVSLINTSLLVHLFESQIPELSSLILFLCRNAS